MRKYKYNNTTTKYILYIVAITILFSLMITIDNSYINDNNVSALDYSSNVDIGFTFNPTLSISLSSSDLIINNLKPGAIDTSNEININISTNNAYGYSLYASAGNEDHGSTDLIHNDNIGAFSSIGTNANLPTLISDNSWGYSCSLDNSNNWTPYNGLPLYTNAPNRITRSTEPVEDIVNFKIAARASTAQPSGAYSNVINFSAVAIISPITLSEAYASEGKELYKGYYKMQDMTSAICKKTEDINAQLQVIDVRDDKIYRIAKLADDHCWMTQNLDLDGGTEITSELSDVPDGYILPITNGFKEGNRLPDSQIGYFTDRTKAYVYNSGNPTNDCSYSGCYSYYSWHAATAGSGVNSMPDNTDAPYSICPKNWRLPNTRYKAENNASDLRNLMVALGGSIDISKYNGTTSPLNAKIYNIISSPPISFLKAGYVNYTAKPVSSVNNYGEYWTATSGGSSAYSLAIYSGPTIDVAEWFDKNYGYAVRCLAR